MWYSGGSSRSCQRKFKKKKSQQIFPFRYVLPSTFEWILCCFAFFVITLFTLYFVYILRTNSMYGYTFYFIGFWQMTHSLKCSYTHFQSHSPFPSHCGCCSCVHHFIYSFIFVCMCVCVWQFSNDVNKPILTSIDVYFAAFSRHSHCALAMYAENWVRQNHSSAYIIASTRNQFFLLHHKHTIFSLSLAAHWIKLIGHS